MQQRQNFAGAEDGSDGGAQHQQMEDMTRLTDKEQMENFLTYGKWDLNDASIEKLIKDDERKERVSTFIFIDIFFIKKERKKGGMGILSEYF